VKRASTHRSPARFLARTLPGAAPGPQPGFVSPCLASLHRAVPDRDGWLYEVKFDGYRIQAHLVNGVPTLYTRQGHDWTHRFKPLAQALAALPANGIILDGEVVVPDAKGITRFESLQEDLSAGHTGRMHYYAFDLLYLDGFDLRSAPLVERKRVLAALLEGSPSPRVHYSSHADSDGQAIFARACEDGLEGIVCKRADASYRPGRSLTWLKIKCSREEILPIIGFKPEGNRVASLLLGRPRGKELVFAGKAGTGFTTRVAADLRRRLDPLTVARPPVAMPAREKATWVKPKLSAAVSYREVTVQGLLRHAVFKRLAGKED
jgi:bifunctional non-homologous end joining protein LigD